MRALITGGSGFLGGHLVDECVRRGDQVRVLVRPTSDLGHLRTVPGIELVSGDLTDPASLHAATRGMDVVYHSAARVQDFGTRAQFWAANVTGTRNLLAAARSSGVPRFVHVSSPSAVMSGDPQIDIDESVRYPDRFLNLYSETKAVAEQIVLDANSRQLTTCAIRPRGIWGPRDRTGFLPRLLAKLHRGTLPDLSGPEPVHASLCHCHNAASACRLAAVSDRVGGRAYFVADAERIDVWALIARVAELFDLRPPTRRVPGPLLAGAVGLVELLWQVPPLARRRPPPVSRYGLALLTRTSTYDTRASSRDFGYRPGVDLETGLAQLKHWVEEIGGVAALAREARE
ncbi:NAD-dependent epimerase/dehydratase family protein [Micromonospora avicenniae]|uniref:Nucleoside-diphosphate-sugar epimerase n=1 Tax=Micromonospora avicenniae TaxID=1198245 RepID=A0A1N6VU92_9ACTN|nr:NAD-dependent epimerase/dehydratase family protein [Micromonospora avicenniae]SIQ81433.1 Nucleoside-diphosphate-sugar epimerase [Micromonospora avicenniae]